MQSSHSEKSLNLLTGCLQTFFFVLHGLFSSKVPGHPPAVHSELESHFTDS